MEKVHSRKENPVLLSEVRSTKPKDLRIYGLLSSNQMRRSFDSLRSLRMTGFSFSEVADCCAVGKVKGASRRSPTTGFSLSTSDWEKPECMLCPSSVSPADCHLPPGEGLGMFAFPHRVLRHFVAYCPLQSKIYDFCQLPQRGSPWGCYPKGKAFRVSSGGEAFGRCPAFRTQSRNIAPRLPRRAWGFPKGNGIPIGRSGAPFGRLLGVLSCRNKKVPPPAGTGSPSP